MSHRIQRIIFILLFILHAMSATTMKLLQHKAYGDPTLGSTLVPIVIFQNPDVAPPPKQVRST
jgi:hypothetical protein